MIDEVVGSYRVVRELGRGGMGVVYVAEHLVLGNKVAVKMLLPRFSADREALARFFNEARAATRIRHPGLVAVFDYGRHVSGSAYLIMELLEGEPLANRRKRLGRLPVRQALVIARQVARALEAVHAVGIVHRDLKPHNLFLIADPEVPTGERVKVLDFGVAKLLGDIAPGADATGEGSVLGTPKYMAPEQCRGSTKVDARADVYSLGCILFELICGEPPFIGEATGEVMYKHLHLKPPRPSERVKGLPPGVEKLILRCLEKDPASRPASMSQLAVTLEGLIQSAPDEALAPTPPPTDPTSPPAGFTMTSTTTPPVRAVESPANLSAGTTLGSSAAELSSVPATRTSRSPHWPGVALLVTVVALAGGSAVWLASRTDEPTATLVTAPPADAAAAPHVATDAAAPDATAPSRMPALITLRFTSEPPGAAVIRVADGVWMGQCPASFKMTPVDGVAEFSLRLRGYREQRVTIRTDADGQAHAVLVREAPGARTSAPPADAGQHVDRPKIDDGFLDPFQSDAPK